MLLGKVGIHAWDLKNDQLEFATQEQFSSTQVELNFTFIEEYPLRQLLNCKQKF